MSHMRTGVNTNELEKIKEFIQTWFFKNIHIHRLQLGVDEPLPSATAFSASIMAWDGRVFFSSVLTGLSFAPSLMAFSNDGS
jgi:hypothetical protein